ncbi:hypothetical protein [Streptomyces sp. PSAA01]|uniref:hypothetical protein n=1 Tax=Streptomyces sp. PSAA01 TaxID=2912762 RepID=UPI001F25EFCF|nr:hypothetical protein [Streptomyces sp. PSAA01]MCG0287321.1 hypothetical protein [Streptomyces sp. PSAA01]
MTPTPAATRTDLVDTTEGTVHMVIGGGGTSVPSMDVLFAVTGLYGRVEPVDTFTLRRTRGDGELRR